VIIIGGTGTIDISQSCTIDSATCQLKASFDTNIQDIIQSVIQQTETSFSGLLPDFTTVVQDVNINTVIQNSITQLMSSSCAIESENTKNSNYILVANHDGDINLSQTGTITSSTCSMDNMAKAATYTQVTNDASQKSTTISILALFVVGFIVLVIVMGIVLITFILSGGASKLISAAADTTKQGMQTLSDNPQLAAALL